MKPTIISTALAGCLCLSSLPVLADSHGMGSAKQLAEEKQCVACHGSSEDVPRAPAFSSIAQKYTKDDMDMLVKVVMTGGEDHWGSAKMPDMDARAEVSEKEAKKLVKWILKMRSDKM